MDVLQQADQEGLDPNDYHLKALHRYLAQTKINFVVVDNLLKDALFRYVKDISGIIPAKVEDEPVYWKIQTDKKKLNQKIQELLTAPELKPALEDLLPKDPRYSGLKKALNTYKNLAEHGEWSPIPSGSKLKKGDRGERVSLLKKRLKIAGDDFFDENLEKALRHFQQGHGLEADGLVGRETLEELNVPLKARIHQIQMNLARLRWLPRDLGERHIFVNIPDFHLEVIDHGKVVFTSKIVVGLKKDWQTPLVSSRITHLVINPTWTVPPKIIEEEILEKIQEDPEYLTKEKMKVFRQSGETLEEVDPSSLTGHKVPLEELQVVQKEGDGNALGRIKFLFPNPYSIYLHDTSQRMLFGSRQRALSHGCVRVEKPNELALLLLQAEGDWNEKKLNRLIKTKKTRYLKLSHPVDVHVFYLTAWVNNEEGTIQFRKDIYQKDLLIPKAVNTLQK